MSLLVFGMTYETLLTWHHAIKYREDAKTYGFKPRVINCEKKERTVLMPLSPDLKVRDIRDWLADNDLSYSISGVFHHEEGEERLPHYLRIGFQNDNQSSYGASLFRLRWGHLTG